MILTEVMTRDYKKKKTKRDERCKVNGETLSFLSYLSPAPFYPLSIPFIHFPIIHKATFFYCFKGNTKFWYGVMNLVQMNILEAYTILQYSVIVVAVEIDSKVMKL